MSDSDFISIEDIDILNATKGVKATIKQIERAQKKATTKTIRRLHGSVLRDLARSHDIPAKSFKPNAARKDGGRRYTGRVIKTKSRVWIGTNAIKSGYVGGLKNAPNHFGAFARKYFFKNGFVATMKSGHKGIFARDYSSRKIQEQEVELVQRDAVYKRATSQVESVYRKVFGQELNYEVNVRGK